MSSNFFPVCSEILLSIVAEMKLLVIFCSYIYVLVILGGSTAQNSEARCEIPVDIPLSRTNRLHHACESNQNSNFAIETHRDFYCVFYSSSLTSLFELETKLEIQVTGDWDHEQVCN